MFLDLSRVVPSSDTPPDKAWAASPRGDPSLVPMALLVRFLDLAQNNGDADEACGVARHILALEPTNRLVRDYLPLVEMRRKLQDDDTTSCSSEQSAL